jgi:uncharacterized protein (DUF983 family)
MRIYALLVLCAVVSLLSGLTLFWSITTRQGELWMHALFLIATITGLLATLSLIRRVADKSISSTMKIDYENQPSPREDRKAG